MSTAGKSILMVDDDQEIRELLQTYLSRCGLQVHAEADGQGFRRALESTPCDLVILDVMLPDEDGFSLCRWVRQHPRQSRVPIIMLTASSDEADRVIGLELGADDYLAKPCDPRELTARLRAVLRRSHPTATTTQVEIGDLAFSPVRGVVSIDGREMSLTLSESRILEALLRQPGEPLDKQELAQIGLGRKLTLYDRSLDMHVSNLRKKIGPHADGRPRIVALRSRGYYYSL